MRREFYRRLVVHINRKAWWHVPPADPGAYRKRGKFLASSFREAQFYGRPLDEPQRVRVTRPLVGDEKSIAKRLNLRPQDQDMTLDEIAAHDAKWKTAALRKGFDSIVVMLPKSFVEFKACGKVPRSLELNIFFDDA